ncbi:MULTISPECIES: MerR family transcriptional regulator [Nocardia]|uniref:MerR family transcriptional regulator n=1 Tax=Nocardia TaxID=1817 RepID=UPI00292D2057|nr:MerR family transcriptional regulator [Nocardia canadensis]
MVNLNSPVGRTIDVARRAGYSVQQVRNLERDGVLPPADRSPGGHRGYREIHARSALAYRALAAGVGPVEAKRIMRTAHAGDRAATLALLDAAHTGLHTERAELALARQAAEAIAAEPITDVRGSDAMSIAELATALGLRTSTLRHWDAEGLVVPDRRSSGRHYSPAQVRDARIVHQLRRAGYRVAQVRAVMPELRRHSGQIRAALAARDSAITARSLALLDGAAALRDLLAG